MKVKTKQPRQRCDGRPPLTGACKFGCANSLQQNFFFFVFRFSFLLPETVKMRKFSNIDADYKFTIYKILQAGRIGAIFFLNWGVDEEDSVIWTVIAQMKEKPNLDEPRNDNVGLGSTLLALIF